MKVEELRTPIGELLSDSDRPVVVFSALWPLARATRSPAEALCEELHGLLAELTGQRTLLMPAFAAGFRDGVCDLDEEPSRTGALTEYFRKQPGVRRSICAFFSFVVQGPDADEIVSLRPVHAWGDGSLYAWMYERDARILTLGVHPTHCAYTHHAEWLARNRIPYRYDKQFAGEIVHEGRRFDRAQTLLVRKLDPPAQNDFTFLLDTYRTRGLRHTVVDGVSLSEMGARAKIDAIMERLDEDPLALLQNRSDFEPCHG